MSLSDTCFDFVAQMQAAPSDEARREAVTDLQRAIEHYSRYPFSYGNELRVLADACTEFLCGRSTSNADPVQRIVFLADVIRAELDTPPGHCAVAS
jgi:hypothetical protein